MEGVVEVRGLLLLRRVVGSKRSWRMFMGERGNRRAR